MAKDFSKTYDKFIERSQKQLKIPNLMTEQLSRWTYADMKREFAGSAELFADNGFKDECLFLAADCIRLRPKNGSAYFMTENAMLETILANALINSDDPPVNWLKKYYKNKISEYKNAPTHGLILCSAEQAELERDIENISEKIRGLNETAEPIPKHYETIEWEKAPFDSFDLEDCDDALYSYVPPADSDKRMKKRLSNSAYEILTEYEREKIIDPDILEKKYLLPNGLKLTDKLRGYIELYDGRTIMWLDRKFYMDAVETRVQGQMLETIIEAPIYVLDGKFYIKIMLEFGSLCETYIGSDGKIYEEGHDGYEFAANSIEEFLESQAREYLKSQLLLERRRELENKYLIPEIRTASM